MNPLEIREILMWGGIIALVALVTFTGMCINRFFIHRAHRRALAELHRRATGMDAPAAILTPAPARATGSQHGTEDIESAQR